ncbi:MAG TPA: arginase family protein [Candidatus Limnocylindria bacterium]|nr:arginase family protein [Candidatus Limnocylindria bacterium]
MTDPTFLGLPAVDPGQLEPGQLDAAILGIPHGVAYPDPGLTAGCADAPRAIRHRSLRLAGFIGHHDFDLDGPMLPPGSGYRLADAGDVAGAPADGLPNAVRAEAAVRALLDAGVVPLILGGDDSIPIPVLRAYAGRGPLTVLQLDAHLDFRDEVDGVREGYSSAMRRVSEMYHVGRTIQVGLRGVGSARSIDVADARAAGNLLVTARELRERGVAWLLEQLPADEPVFVVFDVDSLDPSLAPAVSGLSPGGLSYDQATDLLGGVVQRCRLVGASFTELVPALDAAGTSTLIVVRLLMQLIGALARRD